MSKILSASLALIEEMPLGASEHSRIIPLDERIAMVDAVERVGFVVRNGNEVTFTALGLQHLDEGRALVENMRGIIALSDEEFDALERLEAGFSEYA